jgi:hypothetical protein
MQKMNIVEGDGFKGWNECNAKKDVMEIYRKCEGKLSKELFCCGNKECVRELFQMFRYALREWGVGKREERVMNAIMYAEPIIKKEEIQSDGEAVIFVEDKGVAQIIEEMLRGEGYQEEGNSDY